MSTTISVPASYPFELDNSQRAGRARVALRAFGAVNRQDDPVYLTDPDAITEITGDLICGLLHNAEEWGADPAQVAEYGRGRYEDDLEEVAEADDPARAEDLKARPVVRHPLKMIREIFAILDGPDEWEAETIELVAEVFYRNGFEIRDPGDHPENADLYQDAEMAGAAA